MLRTRRTADTTHVSAPARVDIAVCAQMPDADRVVTTCRALAPDLAVAAVDDLCRRPGRGWSVPPSGGVAIRCASHRGAVTETELRDARNGRLVAVVRAEVEAATSPRQRSSPASVSADPRRACRPPRTVVLAVAASRALEAWVPWRDDDPRTARRTLGLRDQTAPPLDLQPERASAVLTSVVSTLASARYAVPLLLACAHGGAPVESQLVPTGGRAGHHGGAPQRIEPAAFAVRSVEVLPVPLPCVRGIGPGAVLALLAAGVPTVAVRPCGRADSAWGDGGTSAAFVREALKAVGEPPGRLVTVETPPVTEPLGRALDEVVPSDDGSQGPTPVPVAVEEPAATVAALLALTRRHGRLRGALDGQGCPLGSVALAGTCTACGACVSACPSGALRLHRDSAAATLLSRPDLCSACGACVAACPEQVLGVQRGVGPSIPVGAETVLARDTAVSCRRCGVPLGTLAFLARSRPGAGLLCASCAAPLGVDGLPYPAPRLLHRAGAG